MRWIQPALNEAKIHLFLQSDRQTFPLLTYLVSRPKDLGDDELFCWKTEQTPHDTQTGIHKLHRNFDSPRGLFLGKFQSTQDGLYVMTQDYMWNLKCSDVEP